MCRNGPFVLCDHLGLAGLAQGLGCNDAGAMELQAVTWQRRLLSPDEFPVSISSEPLQ